MRQKPAAVKLQVLDLNVLHAEQLDPVPLTGLKHHVWSNLNAVQLCMSSNGGYKVHSSDSNHSFPSNCKNWKSHVSLTGRCWTSQFGT